MGRGQFFFFKQVWWLISIISWMGFGITMETKPWVYLELPRLDYLRWGEANPNCELHHCTDWGLWKLIVSFHYLLPPKFRHIVTRCFKLLLRDSPQPHPHDYCTLNYEPKWILPSWICFCQVFPHNYKTVNLYSNNQSVLVRVSSVMINTKYSVGREGLISACSL